MAGVELIALAIESDFTGGIRKFQKWFEILADFVFGSSIVLVYFYYRRRPRFAFKLCLFGVPAIAVLLSLILFRTTAYWFNFIPIVIGMVMHQMLELSESCGDLEREVEELKHKLLESSESLKLVESTETPGAAGTPLAINQNEIPQQEKIKPPDAELPSFRG